MTNGFTFYPSYHMAIKGLDDKTRLALFDAITGYGIDEIEPELDGVASALFELMRPNIDTSVKRINAGKRKGKGEEASSESAEKQEEASSESAEKQNADLLKSKNEVCFETIEIEIEKEIEKEIEEKKKERKSTRFSPPSVEQVSEYCKERNNDVDPNAFIDFYASKGWKVGDQPMKDWKAAVRTWERRDNRPKAPPGNKFNNFDQRKNGLDDIQRQLARNARGSNGKRVSATT